MGATTGDFWGAAGTGLIVGAATALTLASGGWKAAVAKGFGKKGLAMYLAGAGLRVGIGASEGYLGGLAFGTTTGMLQGHSFSESFAIGNKYGMIGAAVGGGLQVAGEIWTAARGGSALWARPGVARAGTQRAGLLTRARRLVSDPRQFRNISREYWAVRGPARGRSLHHWLIPQRATWVPERIRNAGFNMIELPALRGVFHRSLPLNQWMGLAARWGGTRAVAARVVENVIRVGIPAAAAGTAYASYWTGGELSDWLLGEE